LSLTDETIETSKSKSTTIIYIEVLYHGREATGRGSNSVLNIHDAVRWTRWGKLRAIEVMCLSVVATTVTSDN
jgi:hypothetical protein